MERKKYFLCLYEMCVRARGTGWISRVGLANILLSKGLVVNMLLDA